MKSMIWFDDKFRPHFLISWRKWYIQFPFIFSKSGVDYPIIWAFAKPKLFGSLPILHQASLSIGKYTDTNKVLPIVYRREK